MKRSSKSKSFMRESEFIAIANEEDEDAPETILNEKGVEISSFLNLDYAFAKTSTGKLLLSKKALLSLTMEKGMNYNVVVNAINLQDHSMNQIKKIIERLKKELVLNKVKGILEFHANDTTQASYHFHFWTWKHYEDKARAVMTDFMIENNYATYMNVKIEGQFNKSIEKTSSREEKDSLLEKNRASKINEKDEKFSFRLIEENERKRKDRFRFLDVLNESKTALPLLEKKEDIFSKILKQAKAQAGKKREVESSPSFRFSSVPSFDKEEEFDFEELKKRVALLKQKIKSQK